MISRPRPEGISMAASAAVAASAWCMATLWLVERGGDKRRVEQKKDDCGSVTSTTTTTTTSSSRDYSLLRHASLRFSPLPMPTLLLREPSSSAFPSSSSLTCRCDAAAATELRPPAPPDVALKPTPSALIRLSHRRTIRRMNSEASPNTLSARYEVRRDAPLGEGSYGLVYLCRDKRTGEELALKEINKEFTDAEDFQREMNAMLHIRSQGGHPNLCMLRENFDESDHYVLILDLIRGGELFDHLIEHGAYSEADASRLVREVAGALAFLHGIGVVHADLKPENLMLSRESSRDTAVKVVDFGCAEVLPDYWGDGPPLDDNDELEEAVIQRALLMPARTICPGRSGGTTPAYCPPEAFDSDGTPIRPSMDMWSFGIILYIMLTGLHPFDLVGNATDEEIEDNIQTRRAPPLVDCVHTEHLSSSAIDLLSKLMAVDPNKRLTAHEMLQHPWVTGETARLDVIEGSDRRLKQFRRFRSGIERKAFEDLVSWSENDARKDPAMKGSSLLERAFSALDTERKGFLTAEDLAGIDAEASSDNVKSEESENADDGSDAVGCGPSSESLSFSGFTDLLSENMQHKYFPRGSVVYREGDYGENMYFINSGTVQVSTEDGFRTKLSQGDSFGEGGVQGRPRSATIRCVTPVSAIQIHKEYFKKYTGDGKLALKLREKVNAHRFGRAEFILRQQENVKDVVFDKGDVIFEEGEEGDAMYMVESGKVDVCAKGHRVYSLKRGDLFGVQSFVVKRPRKATAFCVSDKCHLKSMDGCDFNTLLRSTPKLKEAINELSLRREFRRAVVLRRKKSFPSSAELKEAFDELDLDRTGSLKPDEVREVLKNLDKTLSEDEVKDLLKSLDLNESGCINFEEFKSVFGRE